MYQSVYIKHHSIHIHENEFRTNLETKSTVIIVTYYEENHVDSREVQSSLLCKGVHTKE